MTPNNTTELICKNYRIPDCSLDYYNETCYCGNALVNSDEGICFDEMFIPHCTFETNITHDCWCND